MVRTLVSVVLASFLVAPAAPAARVIDIAAGEQDVTVMGADPDDRMTNWNGVVVGDLNGDGADDLVLGASTSNGQANGHPDAGEVHVYFGPLAPANIDARVRPGDLTIYGASSGDMLGVGLSIGDVSGDGRPDLVMGARQSDCPGGRIEAGRVFVLFGPLGPGVRTLAFTPADAVILGASREDGLGFSTAVADLSGDGIGDLVAFAPRADGPGGRRSACGEGNILFGPLPTGLVHDLSVTPPDVLVFGAADYADLGDCVAAGDVSGDGVADLLMGDMGADRDDPILGGQYGVGAVHVLFGPLATGAILDLASDPGDVFVLGPRIDAYRLGSAVLAGDVDGDGRGDLVMGARHATHPTLGLPTGGVHVLHGPLAAGTFHDLDVASADASIYGDDPSGPRFGNALAAVDLDRDGIADLAVGEPYSDATARFRMFAGNVHLFKGPLRRGEVRDLLVAPADITIHGADVADHLGQDLASGDLDGDGLRDIVAGAFGGGGPTNSRARAGEAHVVFLGDENSAPTAMAGADQTVSCRSALLTGSGIDPDGDPLTATWTSSRADATFMPGTGSFTPTVTVGDACDRTCTFTLLVDDGRGGLGTDEVIVMFADHEAPQVSPDIADPRCLWPPNHEMTCFNQADWAPSILDTCSLPTTWRFASCTSDQPEDDRGDGHHAPDCEVATDGSRFCVRAERQGAVRVGRSYTVSIIATDACGKESPPTAVGSVLVPHDLRDATMSGCAR